MLTYKNNPSENAIQKEVFLMKSLSLFGTFPNQKTFLDQFSDLEQCHYGQQPANLDKSWLTWPLGWPTLGTEIPQKEYRQIGRAHV